MDRLSPTDGSKATRDFITLPKSTRANKDKSLLSPLEKHSYLSPKPQLPIPAFGQPIHSFPTILISKGSIGFTNDLHGDKKNLNL